MSNISQITLSMISNCLKSSSVFSLSDVANLSTKDMTSSLFESSIINSFNRG